MSTKDSNQDPNIGKIYDKLEILSLYKNEGNKKYYTCRCIGCTWEGPLRLDSIKRYGATSKCYCPKRYAINKSDKDKLKNDLTGMTFGDLYVEEFVELKNHHSMWKCLCLLCGNNHPIVSGTNLISGNSTKCRECSDKNIAQNRLEDLTGKTIGDFYVIERDLEKESKIPYRAVYWKCKCINCGGYSSQLASHLKSNDYSHQCSVCNNPNIKHGMTGTHFYLTWRNMKERCYNPNNPKYKDYGARGISVSDEWIDDFLKFKEDMYNSYLEHKAIYGDDTSIDRIDNDGNYCKENCRWATVEEQQNNTRITNKYNIPGYEDQYSIRELINSGIAECKNYDTIKGRLNRGGLDIQEAIMDLEGRRKAKAPISFYDDNGNKIQDPYNNRH